MLMNFWGLISVEQQGSSTPNASSVPKRLALSQPELGASDLLGTAEDV